MVNMLFSSGSKKPTVKPVLSKLLRESQKVVALDRCLLNVGKFTHIFLLWDTQEMAFKYRWLLKSLTASDNPDLYE